MSRENSENGFLERLEWVLDGQKVTPWGRSVGLSSGLIDRINKGQLPAGDVLAHIARIEQVALNWLMLGDGPRYPIAHFFDDESSREHLETVLGDEPERTVTMVRTSDTRNGSPMLVMTELPAQVEYRDKWIDYTERSWMRLPDQDPYTADFLAGLHTCYAINAPAVITRALESGQIGGRRALRMLEPYSGQYMAAEPVSVYQVSSGNSESLRDQIAQLSERDQRLLQALISEMNKE